jgi:probable rRNA maturation factor
MELIFVNKTEKEVPETFLTDWVQEVEALLLKNNVEIPKPAEELILVFVDEAGMHDLNKEFRSKDRPTDVLSFAPVEESCLGELVFCREVIEVNAKDHGLSYEAELAYMCLHGILHLLGYDHEESEEEAKIMFSLQDSIFEELSPEFF